MKTLLILAAVPIVALWIAVVLVRRGLVAQRVARRRREREAHHDRLAAEDSKLLDGLKQQAQPPATPSKPEQQSSNLRRQSHGAEVE